MKKRQKDQPFKKISKIDTNDYKYIRKLKFSYFFSFLGIALFSLYLYRYVFVETNNLMALTMSLCIVSFLCNLIILKLTKNVDLVTFIALVLCTILFTITIIDGGYKDHGLHWILIFPLLAYYLTGKKIGSLFIAGLLIISTSLLILSQTRIITLPYSLAVFIDIYTVFITITLMSFFYEDTTSRNEKKIKHQLYNDSLTNMPNRIQLMEDISKNKNLVLLLINIDDFQVINNFYGNKIGDKAIIEFSERLKTFKNKENIFDIYKLHADEFAILLYKIKSKKNIEIIARKIHRKLSRALLINNLDISLRVSIGIAYKKGDLIADANIALKIAKLDYEDYAFFEKSMQIAEKYENNLKWMKKLKKAITLDNIFPFFQPIINNSTGEIEKYECLIRLMDENIIVPPASFLEISKRSKIYPYLTKIMILKSFEAFKKENFCFSINISVEDIMNNYTIDFIEDSLKDYDIGERVVFEITESGRIGNLDKLSEFIKRIKKFGCKIAIDDFGSGYSNFDYILNMDVDYIKIDASLIKNIHKDKSCQILTETIVDFTKKLNIKTIAEFVHSKEVYKKIKELNIDYSQGYFLGKPGPLIKN